MDLEKRMREHAIELGCLYWKDALLQPKQRGGRCRVSPHENMLTEWGYLKRIVVMGEEVDALFDRLYLEYYNKAMGVICLHDKPTESQHTNPASHDTLSDITCLQSIVSKFLLDGSIEVSGSNPRHSLFIKFRHYLEAYHVRQTN